MNPKLSIAILAVSLISACATPAMLPQTDTAVDYSAAGYVEGSGWHDGAVYEATENEITAAIRASLLANGLQIQEFSSENKRFVAESPMNLYRWARYVAVYYRTLPSQKIEIHVVSIGTKDINVLAGDSEMPLPPRIVASVSSNLSRRTK